MEENVDSITCQEVLTPGQLYLMFLKVISWLFDEHILGRFVFVCFLKFCVTSFFVLQYLGFIQFYRSWLLLPLTLIKNRNTTRSWCCLLFLVDPYIQ